MAYKTDLSVRRYPAISRAALEMSYCNGGINRYRSEADALKALDRLLSSGPDIAFDLPAIDAWLATLAEDQMLTVVDGEQGEAEEILCTAPAGTDLLLNDIFEHAA